jgi:hypothetical protein
MSNNENISIGICDAIILEKRKKYKPLDIKKLKHPYGED